MKRGFTLIELLAVIVILAIIALIATPIILGIIDSAGNEAIERSVENYLKAVNLAVIKENLNREYNPNKCYVQVDGSLLCDDETESILVEIDGNHPTYGIIIFENGNVSGYTNLKMDENTYISKETEGESGTSYTGIIYRNSTQNLGIGENFKHNKWCVVVPSEQNSCVKNNYFNPTYTSQTRCKEAIEDVANSGNLDETTQNIVSNAGCEPIAITYETNIANITQNYYLKHEVENNVVTASYSCIAYTENGVRKDSCVRGGNSSYYTSNQEIIRGLESYFGTLDFSGNATGKGACDIEDSYSYCYSDSLTQYADFSGNVDAVTGSLNCNVTSNGDSRCYNS